MKSNVSEAIKAAIEAAPSMREHMKRMINVHRANIKLVSESDYKDDAARERAGRTVINLEAQIERAKEFVAAL